MRKRNLAPGKNLPKPCKGLKPGLERAKCKNFYKFKCDEDLDNKNICRKILEDFSDAEWLPREKEVKIQGDGITVAKFGGCVEIDGSTIITGAPEDGSPRNFGAAYIHVRHGLGWSQQAKLIPSDVDDLDYFGFDVGISGDTAIVGAYLDDKEGTFNAQGSAYFFVRDDSTGIWSEEQKVVAFDAMDADQFGISVAIEGETAVIGALQDDDNGSNSGSVYVYTRLENSTWSLEEKLTDEDGAIRAYLGIDCAISDNTIVVGAFGDDRFTGSASVFVRDGTSWSQQAKLQASNGVRGSFFGREVAISGDIIVVGSPNENLREGSAYVFVRDTSTGIWTQEARLTGSDAESGDQFGSSVAIAGDTIVVGAETDNDDILGGKSGSAYVFVRSGTTWSEKGKVTASDGYADAYFGSSAAISDNEKTVVIGSDTGNFATNIGAAYIYDVDQI